MARMRTRWLAASAALGLVLSGPGGAAAVGGSGGWNPLGNGGTPSVSAIKDKVYVLEQVGSKLYVGGLFDNAGGIAAADRIAIWDGSTWSAVGGGLGDVPSGTVYAIAVDTQTGRVFAGGSFANAGGDTSADSVAVWTGSAWRKVGGSGTPNLGPVFTMEIIGRTLYVGGGFADLAGITQADSIAAFGLDGGGWTAITDESGDIGGTPSDIESDGSGGFYLSGNFINVDEQGTADFVVRYMGGTTWQDVGGGPGGRVYGLARVGSDLYGVRETQLVRWNGSTWSGLGGAVPGTLAEVVVDDGRPIVVGGFLNAFSKPKLDSIMAWNGADFTNVGTDAAGTNGPAGDLRDAVVMGSRLYVGGLSGAIGGGARNDFVAFVRLRQPDGTIATGGAALGDDRYNGTGSGQAKGRSVAQGASGTFTIRIGNDGLRPDDIVIKGPGSGAGFTARYTVGGTNVTAAIVGGTYTIADLAPGAVRAITLRVSVGGGVADGAKRSWLVVARSQGAGAAKDAVKATVTAS